MKCNYKLTKLSESHQARIRQDFENLLNAFENGPRFKVGKLELASTECWIENNCPNQLWINSHVYCCDKEKLKFINSESI